MIKFNYKLFFKKRNQRISFFGFSPSFDWQFILALGTILFLSGAVYIGILYTKILNESLFEVEDSENVDLIIENQSKKIQEVVEELEQRSVRLNPVVEEIVVEEILTNEE